MTRKLTFQQTIALKCGANSALSNSFWVICSLLLIINSGVSHALEGQASFSPDKAKQLKEINKGYRSCTQAAVLDLKAGKLKPELLAGTLTACQERFPAASLYLKCKQNLLKNSPKGKAPDSADAAKCQRFLNAATFESSEPVPYFLYENQLFFAGLGLNADVKTSNFSLPNFSCEDYLGAEKDPASAKYILFGNFPVSFGKTMARQPDYLAKLVKVYVDTFTANRAKNPKIKQEFVDIKGFGRVFPESKKTGGKSQVVYFPTAPCHFQSTPGKIFSGLSAFYLMDPARKLGTPYFGITYYAPDQKVATTSSLVSETLKRLGPGYKPYKKDSETLYLASGGFADLDSEGDPRNVCAEPRKHQFVGIVRSIKGKPTVPEYLILANIKNLCDYGDRLASLFGS